MNKTRIFAVLAVVAAMLMVVPASFAQGRVAPTDGSQGGHGRFGGPGMRGMLLPRSIVNTMTSDQKAQLATIHESLKTKTQELNNRSLTQKEYRTQLRQLHTDARTQAENLLTPDQKAQLATQRKAMMQRHGQGQTPQD